MPLRKIVNIDEDKCDGCGQCVNSCAEGAIQIINGKAKLIADFYCDGLGACLGSCPQGAITIEEREAAEFDEEKTMEHLERLKSQKERSKSAAQQHFTCPGSAVKSISRHQSELSGEETEVQSKLSNWPVKLRLVSVSAPYLKNADLLIVADCVPFANANIHNQFISGRVVLAGCPKFDDSEAYIEKLTHIFKQASPKSVTVLRMEVPCCGGLSYIVEKALEESGMDIPYENVVVSIDGELIKRNLLQRV